MRHPVAVLVPTLALLLVLGSPFLHVRFNAPDASILPPSVPSRRPIDVLAREFGEGEFAPLVLAVRTTATRPSPRTSRALYDYSRRLAADPRVSRVDALVDVDRALTLEQYQLLYGDPGRPAATGSSRPRSPRRQGRPDGVHRLHAVRPEPRRGSGAGRRRCATRGPARPAGRREGARRRRRGGRRRRRVAGLGGLPADRCCSSSSRRTSSCSCSCARSCCRSRRWS